MDLSLQMMALLVNTLSRFVLAFLPRGKLLVMAWLQSPSLVIQEPKIIKSVTASTCFPFIYHEATWLDALILVFGTLSFKLAFSLSFLTLIKKLFSSSHFLPVEWHHLHIWGCWHFSQQFWFQLVIPPAQRVAWCSLPKSWINRLAIYSLFILLSQF